MTRREPLDVHLVDDRLTPRNARGPIVPPRERRIDHHRLRHPRRTVPPIETQIRIGMPDLVPEQRITPRHRPINRPRIGIQQQLRRIEPMPRLRLPRPLHPIPIPHPRPRLRKVDMPHMLRLLRDRNARLPIPLKQTKLDPSSILGKERKIDPRPIPGRAKRIGPPRPPTHRNGPRSRSHKKVLSEPDAISTRPGRLEVARGLGGPVSLPAPPCAPHEVEPSQGRCAAAPNLVVARDPWRPPAAPADALVAGSGSAS